MSTLIVAGTLIINAGAVLNFKLSKNKDETFGEETLTTGDKIRESLQNVRQYRIFIGIWNVLIMVFMILFFSG
ncbi:hypothetical protein ACHWQZ_G012641 [Mnemiopsis leidyi]